MEMLALLDILERSTAFLKQNGVARARRVAEDLLCDALQLRRVDLYLQHDRPLGMEELERIRAWLKRLAKGEPLAYISGVVQFFGCTLHVTPDVLIPRQETELLVDLISKELSSLSLDGKVLWDLCTGSGCIGISLKKRHPQLTVALSDLSEKALAVARRNAQENQVEVELLKGDLLAPFEKRKADFLVCNPPYISEQEFNALDRSVKAHEPRLALVGGESGLEYYARLAQELPRFLKPGAKVWFEIGAAQGAGLFSLFAAAHWKNRRVKKDWAGKERFFSLEIE